MSYNIAILDANRELNLLNSDTLLANKADKVHSHVSTDITDLNATIQTALSGLNVPNTNKVNVLKQTFSATMPDYTGSKVFTDTGVKMENGYYYVFGITGTLNTVTDSISLITMSVTIKEKQHYSNAKSVSSSTSYSYYDWFIFNPNDYGYLNTIDYSITFNLNKAISTLSYPVTFYMLKIPVDYWVNYPANQALLDLFEGRHTLNLQTTGTELIVDLPYNSGYALPFAGLYYVNVACEFQELDSDKATPFGTFAKQQLLIENTKYDGTKYWIKIDESGTGINVSGTSAHTSTFNNNWLAGWKFINVNKSTNPVDNKIRIKLVLPNGYTKVLTYLHYDIQFLGNNESKLLMFGNNYTSNKANY